MTSETAGQQRRERKMTDQISATVERTEDTPFSARIGSLPVFYRDSLITIINADARDVLHKLPRGLTVTDPPYNVGYHYDGYDDNMSVDDYQAMLRETCPPPCAIIHYAEDLCAMSWTLEELPEKIVAWVYPSNTARQWRGIAWWGCKPDFTKDSQTYRNPTDKRIAERIANGEAARLYDWWEINQVKNVSEQKDDHPCQIPLAVMRRILKITDCKLVVDPFCGSGTTLVAAKQLGIEAIGVERNPKYCAIAAKRVAQEMTMG